MSAFPKVFSFLLLVLVLLVVVVFPVIPNVAFINAELWRNVVLIVLAGLLTGVTLLSVALGNSVTVKSNLLTFGLLAWALAQAAAAVASPTPLKSLATPTAWLPAALLLLVTLIYSLLGSKAALGKVAVLVSGLILGLVLLVVMFVAPFGLSVSANTGMLVFLGAALATAVVELAARRGCGGGAKRLACYIPLGAIIVVTTLAAALIIGGGILRLPFLSGKVQMATELSLNSSWRVAAESIKTRPLFGVGPGNFLNAYTAARSDPTRFYQSAGNQLLESLTTTGLVGLVGLVVFLLTAFLTAGRARNLFVRVVGLALGLASGLTLINGLLAVLILALVLGQGDEEGGFSHNLAATAPASRLILAAVGLLFLLTTYLAGRVGLADVYYLKSGQTTALQEIYDSGKQAVSLNPYNDAYHRAYASSSLAIVRYLAQSPNLTDQDKTNITALLRNAVAEVEVATVSLDPGSSLNWQTRASIYAALQGLEQNATTSAYTSSSQAVALDPFNPALRLQLGNFLMTNKAYSQAAQAYASAINIKNDFWEARLGLANALVALGQVPDAIEELRIVQNSVAPGSSDYETLQAKIDALSMEASSAAAKPNSK